MKPIFYFLYIICLLWPQTIKAQGLSDLDKIDKPIEKFEFLHELAKSVTKEYPDSARKYYYQESLKIAETNYFDIQIAIALRCIARTYYYQKRFDTCIQILNEAINISLNENDYTGIIKAYSYKASINYIQANYLLSIENNNEIYKYASITHDTSRLCRASTLSGTCYYILGNYPNALKEYQTALYLSKKTNDLKTQSRALNNMASIQDELKNYKLALKYYQQAIIIKKHMGDKKGAIDSQENMATVYSKIEKYKKALDQYQIVLSYREENIDEKGLPKTLMNIGYVNEKMGHLNQALDYYSKSLKLFYKQDDKTNIAICLNNIGDIYYAQKKFRQAIDSSQKSLAISQKLKSKTRIKSSALSLTKSYVEKNDYKKAYNYHVLYTQMKDSLFNKESAMVLQQMETKHQTEIKQQKIEKQNLTIDKQNLLIDKQEALNRNKKIMLFALLGGFILVLFITFQVYRSYKHKKKAVRLLSIKNVIIKEKNTTLNKANIEITEQKVIIEEKNKNIMDSIKYAERIQNTILPLDSFLKKHLPESFILYKPKDIVSGDFYWMEMLNDRIYISAVDCTGHGVPGAFVSIVGFNNLNKTIMEFHLTKPSEILTKLNDLVVDTFVRRSKSDVKDGMDIALLTIDTKTNQYEFSGAQNPLYIINSENELTVIKGNKYPIGSSIEPKIFDNHYIETKKGDMIYLFSDGYIDQFGGPKGKKFMRKRFKELLLSIHTNNMETQKVILDNTIKDWMLENNEEQLDDILVIGIRV